MLRELYEFHTFFLSYPETNLFVSAYDFYTNRVKTCSLTVADRGGKVSGLEMKIYIVRNYETLENFAHEFRSTLNKRITVIIFLVTFI